MINPLEWLKENEDVVKAHEPVGPGYRVELEEGYYVNTAVFELHERLRERFEGFIWDTGPSKEALLAGQLTAVAVSLVRSLQALDRATESSMCFASLRVAEENASNLFYCLYAGPAHEQRTVSDLSEQFLAYRDVDHARFINKERAEYVARFKAGELPPATTGPQTLAAFESFCDATVTKADHTLARFPKMGKSSWHTTNKEDRTKLVLKHLPVFAEPVRKLWESISHITSLQNFKLHSGPILFQQEPSLIRKGHVLDLEPTSTGRDNQSWVAAMLAKQCWLALGDGLGYLSDVQTCANEVHSDVLLEIAEKHRVPAMWRI